jgi:TPP-dependent pyruvate/acetoin dehydrogenase alpha subunit
MKTSKRVNKKPFSLIPEKRLIELYKAMLECRQLRQIAKVASPPLADEALNCGVLLHLDKNDLLVAAEAALPLRYLKGENLARLLKSSTPDSRCGFHPLPTAKSSSAEQLYLAAGLAMAQKQHSPARVTIAFLNGEVCYGPEWESALRFIVAQQLGLIIVCDGAAKASRRSSATKEEPGSRSAAKGLPPVLQVDRGDCIGVYRVAQEAVTHARENSRSTIIRAFGPREIGSIDPHASLDPIQRMEQYLASKAIRPAAPKAKTLKAFAIKINQLTKR